MWHAARKQERMIRVMMVDYQKRAGRRREYYECIKQDPNQFLRVYGRSMKIHIDPGLAAIAEGPQVMQPWQGDPEVLMDRYDVRSHIDYIPPIQNSKEVADPDENRCNYERYRILVQNDCAGVSEDQCLQQIYQDEQFGASDASKSEEEKKKKLADKRAAIGFIYDDGSSGMRVPDFKKEMMEEEASDEEIDLDNILDIDMLTEDQEQVLNGLSVEYGMEGNDYSEFLQLDRDEMEALRAVKQIEEEKAQFSGRKSRRERRAFKERRLRNRKLSPPSYAAKPSSPNNSNLAKLRGSSSSRSRSRSPPGTGVIEFITCFGGNVGNHSSDDEKRKPLQGLCLPLQLDTNKTIVGPKLPEKGGTTKSERRRSRSPRKRPRSPRKRSRSPRRRSRSPRRRSRGRSRSSRRSRSREKIRSRRSRSRSVEARNNGYRRDYYRRTRRSRSSSSSSRSSSRGPSSRSCSSSSSSYSESSQESSCSRSGSTNTASQVPLKKYRRPSLSSNSGFEDEEQEDEGKKDQGKHVKDSKSSKSELCRNAPGRGSVATSKVSSSSTSSTMTPQERLKRRMQLALSKQYKADKKAQIEKQTKEEQMKQDREEELRLLAVQMRQRDRERRHREREERDRLEAEHEKPTRKRSRSSERSHSRKRSRRSTSRGSRSRRSRSRGSRSRRSRSRR